MAFNSPEEIDAIVASGNMDPKQAERAKAVYFPGYVSPMAGAPQAAIAPTAPAAFDPAMDAPMAPSEGMLGTPAIPAAGQDTMVPPPRMAQTVKTDTQSTRIAPGALSNATAAVNDYAQSASDLMAATAAHNNSIAEQKASLAQQRFEDVEKDAARRELEAAELEGRRKSIRDEIDTLASQKVNSGRFYQNMGTGDKVLAAISVALGGFASAMQGQPGQNAALNIIDKAVQRDIDEQIKNLDNSRQVTALKDQDLARLIQITGSKQAARDALMAKKYETLAAELDAKAAKTPNQVIQARASEIANQLRLKVAEAQMNVERNVTQSTITDAPTAKMGMSEGFKVLDSEFAKDYNDWTNGGAKAAKAELEKLKGVAKDLAKGTVTTGGLTGAFPDRGTDAKVLKARSDVEGSVMNSLKATLGAQFSQKEAERKIKTAWNEADSTQNNLARVNQLITEIESFAKGKNDKSKYFERNGTLAGYKAPAEIREKK